MKYLGKPCKTEKELRTALLELGEKDKEIGEKMIEYASYVLDKKDRAFILAVAVRLKGNDKRAKISAGEGK